jgi:hypothetical protein
VNAAIKIKTMGVHSGWTLGSILRAKRRAMVQLYGQARFLVSGYFTCSDGDPVHLESNPHRAELKGSGATAYLVVDLGSEGKAKLSLSAACEHDVTIHLSPDGAL